MSYFYHNEFFFLCKLFHHYHDGIMLSWEIGNEINSNNFPFPFRNGKWMQHSCYIFVLGLFLLTFHASRQTINDIFLHTRPKILSSYNCNSFLISWMSNIWHIMHLLQNQIYQLLRIGNIIFVLK
jgi:hypothetical protein